MYKNDYIPRSLSCDEMHKIGIDPENIFATCQRIKGFPIDIRFGDDRIQRTSDGEISLSFGYYTEKSINHRKEWAKKLYQEIKRIFCNEPNA